MDKCKEFIFKNKFNILIALILILGIVVRIVGITEFPQGLNQDEASSGYEAYSLLKEGIDRNGKFLPVHFISWGSGQNVLYSYLMIPFILIFGLTELAVRLPMAIIGSISLILTYFTLKRMKDKKFAIVGLAFLAICPWHIMKSRWGLESNLFPDLILIAVYFIIKAIDNKKTYNLYIASLILGLSAYSYGTAYFFLPVFLISLLIYLVRNKQITLKSAIISFVIVGIIALLMVLFTVINTFDLPEINLPFMTIPRLKANRYQEIASVFSSEFIEKTINNFTESIKMLIYQNDNLPWNAMNFFGIVYIFTLPFTILGIVLSFSKKTEFRYKEIFNIWFIVSVILLMICEPNINRCNIIMFPLIFYGIIGIHYCIQKSVYIEISLVLVYLISFVMFLNSYFNADPYFETDLKEVIEYVDELDVDKVYITDNITQPYIYTLFYTEYNPKDYVETVEYFYKDINFEVIKSFGKYNFYIPKVAEENSVYVVLKDRTNINTEDFEITEFERFLVIEK